MKVKKCKKLKTDKINPYAESIKIKKKIISPLMTSKQVAEYLGISEGMVYEQRALGIGPNYIRLGGRLVRYFFSDINAWLKNQKSNFV